MIGHGQGMVDWQCQMHLVRPSARVPWNARTVGSKLDLLLHGLHRLVQWLDLGLRRCSLCPWEEEASLSKGMAAASLDERQHSLCCDGRGKHTHSTEDHWQQGYSLLNCVSGFPAYLLMTCLKPPFSKLGLTFTPPWNPVLSGNPSSPFLLHKEFSFLGKAFSFPIHLHFSSSCHSPFIL